MKLRQSDDFPSRIGHFSPAVEMGYLRYLHLANCLLGLKAIRGTAEPLPQPTSCDPQKVLIVA